MTRSKAQIIIKTLQQTWEIRKIKKKKNQEVKIKKVSAFLSRAAGILHVHTRSQKRFYNDS
jgi:hypothetical protein